MPFPLSPQKVSLLRAPAHGSTSYIAKLIFTVVFLQEHDVEITRWVICNGSGGGENTIIIIIVIIIAVSELLLLLPLRTSVVGVVVCGTCRICAEQRQRCNRSAWEMNCVAAPVAPAAESGGEFAKHGSDEVVGFSLA